MSNLARLCKISNILDSLEQVEIAQRNLVLLRTKPYYQMVVYMLSQLHAWLCSLHEDVLMSAELHGLYSKFPFTWGLPPDVVGMENFINRCRGDIVESDLVVC